MPGRPRGLLNRSKHYRVGCPRYGHFDFDTLYDTQPSRAGHLTLTIPHQINFGTLKRHNRPGFSRHVLAHGKRHVTTRAMRKHRVTR
jgi:hypothetical protein